MKKKARENLEIIGTIPPGLSLFEADFGISEDGTILELSKSAQKKGLLIVKREIKNLSAGIRMYLIHILSRYLTTLRGIKGIEVDFLGKLEEIDLWKVKLSEILEGFKKDKPVIELEVIIKKIEEEKEKIDPLINEIRKKQVQIGRWALKKAKILTKEKKRISDIIENLFIELAKLYDICKNVDKINNYFKEFMFGREYQNLKGEIQKLETIREHFLDYPDDLKKIKEIKKDLLRLEVLEDRRFTDKVKLIMNSMIVLIEGPLEYKVGQNRYIIERGEVRCL